MLVKFVYGSWFLNSRHKFMILKFFSYLRADKCTLYSKCWIIKIEGVIDIGCRFWLLGISYVSRRVWEIIITEWITFLFLENNNTNIILGKNEGCRWKKSISTPLDKNVCSVSVEP
jgi:hypothetical protein